MQITITEWKFVQYDILFSIFGASLLLVTLLMITINQTSIKYRFRLYLLSWSTAYASSIFIMWVSEHDLIPKEANLDALHVGTLFWIISRELQ